MDDPETLTFGPGRTMANSALPVLIYRSALPADGGDFDALFQKTNWRGIWHNGVYDFDHYHSNAHEVLGVARGRARLQLGGDEGSAIEVSRGDCIVLPAGTGHRRISASSDFEMVGAYPPGQEHYDICRQRSADADYRIARIELPKTDPVRGSAGPLLRLWSGSRDQSLARST
jgi:uncharacterized protein YjlB